MGSLPATYELKKKELNRRELEDDIIFSIIIFNLQNHLKTEKISLSISLVKKSNTKVSIVNYKNYEWLRLGR